MWLWMVALVALAGVALALWLYAERRADAQYGPHAPNELIVKFVEGTNEVRMDELHGLAKCRRVGGCEELGTHIVRSKRKMRHMLRAYVKLAEIEYAEPNYTFKSFAMPNDPYFSNYQYGPQRIQAPEAWDITAGAAEVRIAVIDTGVQLNHPDLAGKLTNGYDFVDGDSQPEDRNGHGTHVAGIAAAVTNNGGGIAGVAPLVSIIPVRVLGDDGNGSLSAVADGIVYAANQGAQVVNLSLGSPYSSLTLQNAVQYAWSRGSVIVAAAGNDGSSVPSYPANDANVLAVASTNETDVKSSFSNYGTWVEVAAPGEDILSTYTGSYYAYLSGTSMAAPHVAGVAALLASQGRSRDQIRAAIIGTAEPIRGTGTYWKYGRVSALRAVQSPYS
ncbi:S8 family peptidase [Paenibacillus sp. YYML68]|uniref:S8 family peptidase n=1 Tax=Paenibacillus sp. YYML68 TaxID=2909250 RepID=UPI0024938729|nr:S8 family peptidase [Paenibacillus sp. YYML68]